MNKTPNYNLSQWAKSDRVLMDDFNADNAKIDAALAGIAVTVPKVAAGSYTGSGASSRTISLPFTPKAVFVCSQEGTTAYISGTYEHIHYGGLAIAGHNLSANDGSPILSLYGNGFQVYYNPRSSDKIFVYTNYQDTVYHYVALG